MKSQAVFTYSFHTSRDPCHFQFTKTIQQKHKHSFSDLFASNQLEQRINQKIRRKSCHCNECGRMSKFQYKFMNLKHHQPQPRNQSYTLHASTEHRPIQNRFSIQLPNIDSLNFICSQISILFQIPISNTFAKVRAPFVSVENSQSMINLMNKDLHLCSTTLPLPGPLLFLFNLISALNTTQKLLEDTAHKNKPFRPSVFHSHDGPSPLVLKSQQLITERLPQTERSTNTKIKLRNNPKLLCPLLIGFTKKVLTFSKIKPTQTNKHNRFKTQ